MPLKHVLSSFFLQRFMSWVCIVGDIKGGDRINAFLHSKLPLSAGLGIFDL
jgi:hypothetical protein